MFDISILYIRGILFSPFNINIVTNSLYFDTKLLEKSNQIRRQPEPFIQMKFIFTKRKKRELANIQPSLHFYGMIILVKKKVLCIGKA